MHTTLGHGTVTGRMVGELRVGEYGFSQQFEGTLTGTEDGRPVELLKLMEHKVAASWISVRVSALSTTSPSQILTEILSPLNIRRSDDGFSAEWLKLPPLIRMLG